MDRKTEIELLRKEIEDRQKRLSELELSVFDVGRVSFEINRGGNKIVRVKTSRDYEKQERRVIIAASFDKILPSLDEIMSDLTELRDNLVEIDIDK